jgi:hypothetical protein
MLTQPRGTAALKTLISIAALPTVLLLSTATAAAAQDRSIPIPPQPLPAALQEMIIQNSITHDLQHTRDPDRRQITHDLIEYPGQAQLIGVRCVETHQTTSGHAQPDRFSTAEQSSSTVTVELEGNCREVWIRIQTADSFEAGFPDFDPVDRDDYPHSDHDRSWERSWLTRPGSGWYWLLRH